MSDLELELETVRRTVSTDGYPMSVGELTNLYKSGDLIIKPPFQRLFRWDDNQKSKLIESILVGIPLPSIFVAQDQEGRWELVDGLQRISTLLQLQGVLKDDNLPPLVLRGTKYLPSLEGLVWDSEDGDPSLTPAQRRDIQRSKIDLKIVQRESDPKTKFDLFQRLNSFGARLSNQEIRNAQLFGVNPDFVEWLTGLATYENFGAVIRLPENDITRKYDEELVLRFLYLHDKSDAEISAITHFQDGLEQFAIDLALNFEDAYREESGLVFRRVFDELAEVDEKILGRWDPVAREFRGGFLNTSFEAIAINLGYMRRNGIEVRSDLREAAIEFWEREEMAARYATGKSTEARLRLVVPIGREVFRDS